MAVVFQREEFVIIRCGVNRVFTDGHKTSRKVELTRTAFALELIKTCLMSHSKSCKTVIVHIKQSFIFASYNKAISYKTYIVILSRERSDEFFHQ